MPALPILVHLSSSLAGRTMLGRTEPGRAPGRSAPGRGRRRRGFRPALLAALAAPSIAAAAPASAQSARYEIDPEHLSIGFMAEHLGYAKVLGLFRTAKGGFEFDEKTATLGNVRIEIETASVFTNHRKRDDHLKGPDFLNSGEYPKMTFTAASARRSGERDFVVDGRLELLGKTAPVQLQARWNKSAEYAFGTFRKPYVIGISARGSFKRSAFGMNYGLEWVGDDVDLIVEFEAQRR
ncbi:MAG: YceI family protein [Lautropia sp.]